MSSHTRYIKAHNLYNESFIKRKSGYIEYDEEENCKVFSNIYFETFNLTSENKRMIVQFSDYKYNTSELTDFSGTKELSNLAIKFKNCKFKNLNIKSLFYSSITFDNCEIDAIEINHNLRGDKENKYFPIIIINTNITTLKINNSILECKFYINPQSKLNKNEIEIQKVEITNSVFKENFKLHHAKIERFELEDIDFEKNADFFKSSFIKGILEENKEENTKTDDIGFKSINFKKLALFGDTKFFKKMVFRYVTFEGHNHFKSAELYKGIDLEYTNIQKEINFYGIDIKDKKTTSQETYRIIKHQFEKLGNKIEANKYHALELEQKRIELEKEKGKNWKEYIVFKLHDLSSQHSTNWFRAVTWILIVGLITNLLHNSMWYLLSFPIIGLISYTYPDDLEKKLFIPIILFLSMIFLSNELKFNDIFKYISILTKENDFNYNYFLMTLNKVSLGYLYYQFLMSVRKDTRK
ncbi:hypothetical protein KO488_02890 [Poseidonibacter lekithochrous]|uniref:hypothetical protein n=1 Tax=Poseidonibacter TaxID=2321187 RepID=UPI001C090694|nr:MULTISPECIES: hypothetical protein [Poseidonibacter]MBU3013689.1 hypothetical protein [Poseidonibacter lekithochrous]MDO6826986.1 hypothetical protein [Poseidonibacter sp. 1_MG-2023]